MTYASFLLIFLVPPTLLLVAALLRQGASRRVLLLPAAISLAALLYTTPWDNYLVANQVWGYDADRVSGILLGWVPIEEYLFFVLQPLLSGYWALWVWLRSGSPAPRRLTLHWPILIPLAALWAAAATMLFIGTASWRYLSLLVLWALPPLALQLVFGWASLWRHRRAAALSILPPTLYLAAADGLAISAGVWAISPASSTGWLLLGVLPVEELVFFALTNCLIAFSVLLVAPSPVRLSEAGNRESTAEPASASQRPA